MQTSLIHRLVVTICCLGSLFLIFTLNYYNDKKVNELKSLEIKLDSLQNIIYCQEEEINKVYEIVDSLPLGPPLDTLII